MIRTVLIVKAISLGLLFAETPLQAPPKEGVASVDPEIQSKEPTPNKIFMIPAGATATGKLILEEAEPGLPYDCIVETTTPFLDRNGTHIGPAQIRFLVKFDKKSDTWTAKAVNWFRKNPPESYVGSTSAKIQLNQAANGTVSKLSNRVVPIILENDLKLQLENHEKSMLDFVNAKALAGDIDSILMMGFYYEFGAMGLAADQDVAIEWYKKAVDQGNSEAMISIGNIYSKTSDYRRAFQWYSKGADAKYHRAFFKIACMYINGQHVAKNMDLAIEFLRRGADLDDAECMNLLGLYYATGEGVPKDELRAYVWLTLASSKDHQYAKFRDQIEAKLNGEQKADGQRMAREVYEKHRMLLIQSK